MIAETELQMAVLNKNVTKQQRMIILEMCN
jgi:hypothetical protein